jgi:hypothetical protein
MRPIVNALLALAFFLVPPLLAQTYLIDVPDYEWHAGCLGTACGNVMGYWDRHGLPDLYTGPTAGGVAPLDTYGNNAGIESMWASKAGFDGRPANKPGHIDDYWNYYISDAGSNFSYESTQADPYILAGRAEHAPDCIADFMGLSQKKWTNMNNECDGNIDGYGFVYWDKTGAKRSNYAPPPQGKVPVRDVQSGLRDWMRYRGYDADVFTQLAAGINPDCPAGKGFTFANLQAEINAGCPVMIFLQAPKDFSRRVGNMSRANPEIHGMLAYGYDVWPDPSGASIAIVYVRTSWGDGGGQNYTYRTWSSDSWVGWINLPVRGVIGFHPRPKIKSATRAGANLRLVWEGPASQLYDGASGATISASRYQVEQSPSLAPSQFNPVGPVTTGLTLTVPASPGFYRVKLLAP